jgi:hypothetical protein
MKKLSFCFTLLLFSFLISCNLRKNPYSFAIKHGGKWVDKNNSKIFISLDPSTSFFKGEINCKKIQGNYFLDPKRVKFFEFEFISKKGCKSDEKSKKEEENFIKLLQTAEIHNLDSSNFKLYQGPLLLIHLIREK